METHNHRRLFFKRLADEAARKIPRLRPLLPAPSIAAESRCGSPCGDRVHFLNVGRGGCALLQSGRRFALIDCGPKESAQTVIDYFKSLAAECGAEASLEFIAVTHAHPGHMGALPQILADDGIGVGSLWMKAYYGDNLSDGELLKAEGESLRGAALSAAEKRGVSLCENFPRTDYELGALSLRFINAQTDSYHSAISENDNSLGVLVSKCGRRILLCSDMVNDTGDLARMANLVGRSDVLELPCHGEQLLDRKIIKRLSPRVMIICGSCEQASARALGELLLLTSGSAFSTVENNGIALTLTDLGELSLTGATHDVYKSRKDEQNA